MGHYESVPGCQDPQGAHTEPWGTIGEEESFFRSGAVLFDYARGGNRGYDAARILRDYVVRVTPGSDDLLLGKAHFVVARRRLASSYFLIERYRPQVVVSYDER